MSADASGLNASGNAIDFAASPQRTPSIPPAATAVPMIAPVNECVVETGNPVLDAMNTHTNVPAATASGNAGECAISPPTRAVLNVFNMAAGTLSPPRAPARGPSGPPR